MKKWIALLCALTTVLFLTACGENNSSSSSSEDGSAAPSEAVTTEAATAEATEPATDEVIELEQSDEEILQYYNDVAYWIYCGIELHYNNSFDDAEFVCLINMEDGTWEITDSDAPQGFSDMISEVIADVQAREFESGPKATGSALVKYEYGSLHYTQYTESSDPAEQIIGQYADPARVADGHVQWGVFHNRTRCELCSNA